MFFNVKMTISKAWRGMGRRTGRRSDGVLATGEPMSLLSDGDEGSTGLLGISWAKGAVIAARTSGPGNGFVICMLER